MRCVLEGNREVNGQWLSKLGLQEYESALFHPHERHYQHCLEEGVSPESEADSLDEDLLAMSVWQKIKLLFSDLELIIFLVLAVLFGFATGTIDGYLFLYLDSLGFFSQINLTHLNLRCIPPLQDSLTTAFQDKECCQGFTYPAASSCNQCIVSVLE